MIRSRILQLVVWAAAFWIAYEFLWYEQYKLAGRTLIFDVLSSWSGIPEKPFRLSVAGMEMAAAILVLIPRSQAVGGLFAWGIMSGAIVFHIATPLGIDPYEDGGMLFKEAVFTWFTGLLIVVARRRELAGLARRLLPAARPVVT